MKLIKPSVEFYGAVPTDYESAIKFIETAGRTCYKSEDKITETSAEGFVKKLINAGHLAMVEHSNFVVHNKIPSQYRDPLIFINAPYLKTVTIDDTIYIGGNLRAWAEHTITEGIPDYCAPFTVRYGKLFNIEFNNFGSGLWSCCHNDMIPPSLHRYSAKFICNRTVSHELVRHRPCSFAQESQRYVNYGNKDMEFIEPVNYTSWTLTAKALFEGGLKSDEHTYKNLIKENLLPQQARAKLPNAIKTEIVVTADSSEWSHILSLRTSKAADPEMQRVMNMMPWNKII